MDSLTKSDIQYALGKSQNNNFRYIFIFIVVIVLIIVFVTFLIAAGYITISSPVKQ